MMTSSCANYEAVSLFCVPRAKLFIVVSNDFSPEAKHLTLASGLNLMMTSQCPNKTGYVFYVLILNFENEIQHVVLLSARS